MNATLYRLGKRKNSTYRPVSDDIHIDVDVLLKEGTSTLYPVLSFAGDYTGYNYLYVQELGNRYYFINDWTFESGLWWASCEVDVLATYRTAIYTYNGFILRSADAANRNRSVMDELAVKTAYVTRTYTNLSSPWIANLNAGQYVIGVINSDASSYGACSYYVLTGPQFGALKNFLMSAPSYVTADFASFDISEDLLKALFNPFQYIVSAMFFPVQALGGGTAISSIPVGWWDTGIAATRIEPTPYGFTMENITLAKHPQTYVGTEKFYSFLDSAEYCSYMLHFPPFKDITLDPAQIQRVSAIDLQLLIDPSTGLGSMTVVDHAAQTVILAYTEAQVGVPVQLAQMSTDMSSIKSTAISSAVSGITQAINKSSILSVLGNFEETGRNIISGIGDVATAGSARMLSSGSNGSLAAYFNCKPQLQQLFNHVIEPDPGCCGYPSGYTEYLSSLSGYTLLYNAACPLPSPATSTEYEMVNNLLNSGFYCEWGE